jgi:hypothetical protein
VDWGAEQQQYAAILAYLDACEVGSLNGRDAATQPERRLGFPTMGPAQHKAMMDRIAAAT